MPVAPRGLTFTAPAFLAALLLAAPTPAQADHAGELGKGRGGHHGQLPIRDPNAGPVAQAAPAGAHLTYFGGRVISNVQVIQVIWGAGSYLSNITSTASPSMATFYQGVLNSPYVDWLTEYNTTVGGGTGQTIGRGSFGNQFTITPSITSATISDAQIQSELVAQIAAGRLPAPTADAAGNTNTYYAVFFPSGKRITQGGSSSCVAGGFCAYHGTVAANAAHREFYYGVHPDMQAGSGCATGCGTSPTTFQNQTSVASHELIEAVTDPEVGLATVFAPPLAWYDQTFGEIGDICNAQQGTVVGSDGVTYTVQTEFSNVANNCIVSRAAVTNDFSIAVSPASQTVAPGASTTYTVTTAVTSGTAQAIGLTASPPAGFTATFSPASVTAGGSSTLTVTVAAGSPNQTVSFTVTGTAASGTHTATVTTVVSSAPPPPSPIVNGGFETGTLSGWTASGITGVSTPAHGGAFAARLGSAAPSGTSSIAQTFTAPAGSTQLSFWYRMTCPDTVTFDWATATLRDNTTATTRTILPRTCATNAAYVQVTASVTAGHSYTITLTNRDDNFAGDASFTLFDDVAVR